MLTDEVKKKIEEIVLSKETLYQKYGDKCPYCDYVVPSFLKAKGNSLGRHMVHRHKDKNPSRTDRLYALFTEMVEGEKKESYYEYTCPACGQKTVFEVPTFIC